MRRLPPFNPITGMPDDAMLPWQNGNPATGQEGSIPPTEALVHPMEEIVHTIEHFGLTPTSGDLQQLRKAIEAKIASITGEGDTENFVLMSALRSRLMFYPEVASSNGIVNVISPTGGQVQVPSGVTVMHRSVFPISTADFSEGERTFETDPSKTYHMRLDMDPGNEALVLKDLADNSYNPGSADETDPMFDSVYDSALLARIVTNSSNVPTITNLVNRHKLEHRFARTTTQLIGGHGQQITDSYNYNFARTPSLQLEGWSENATGNPSDGWETQVMPTARTRYGASILSFTAGEQSNQNWAPLYSYYARA